MRRRRGLSLIEILIAVVLLGIVGAGIARLLQSQMRFFSRSTNMRDARAVTRNAVNLMRLELRMVEPSGMVAAGADSIRVQLPYAMGIHCALNTGTFVPVDSLTWATASYGGYAWRDTTPGATYTYVPSNTALAAGLAAACTGVNITPVPGGPLMVVAPAFVAPAGAPMFLYQTVTYRFDASTLVPGRTALWRQAAGGVAEEIAVPFDDDSRFRFYAAGSTTPADAVPSPINTTAGVELVLRGESERTSPGTGSPEVATTRVAIFFRNSVQ